MSERATLEQRLNILEKAVAELQSQVVTTQTPPISIPSHWLDRIVGSISDESAFLQALEYGRLYRQEDTSLDDTRQEQQN